MEMEHIILTVELLRSWQKPESFMQGTISKVLVACPSCEGLGRRQILGELKDGMFVVMRFHNGYTRIRGEFEVLCDKCLEPVYFRTERRINEIPVNRLEWVY